MFVVPSHSLHQRLYIYVRSHLVVNLAPRNSNHSPPPHPNNYYYPFPSWERADLYTNTCSRTETSIPRPTLVHMRTIYMHYVYISISVQAAEMVAPRENSDWQTYRPEFSRIVRCLYLKLMNSTLPYFYISGENSPNTIIYIPGCLPLNGEI